MWQRTIVQYYFKRKKVNKPVLKVLRDKKYLKGIEKIILSRKFFDITIYFFYKILNFKEN